MQIQLTYYHILLISYTKIYCFLVLQILKREHGFNSVEKYGLDDVLMANKKGTQLSRDPKPLPKMILNPEIKDIFDFKFEDFTLENYDPHPHIKGVVAV